MQKSASKQKHELQKNKRDASLDKQPKNIIQFKFVNIEQYQIDEVTKLYVDCFLLMNKVWKTLGASYDQIFSVIRGRIISCVKVGLACGMKNAENKEFAGILLSLDAYDYIKVPPMPHKSQFLKILGVYGSQLESQYFNSLKVNLKRGDYVYNYGGVINPKYSKHGILKKMQAMYSVYLKTRGYKFLIARLTDRIMGGVVKELGNSVSIKKLNFAQKGIEKQFVELALVDLNNLGFQTLQSYFENISPNDMENEYFK